MMAVSTMDKQKHATHNPHPIFPNWTMSITTCEKHLQIFLLWYTCSCHVWWRREWPTRWGRRIQWWRTGGLHRHSSSWCNPHRSVCGSIVIKNCAVVTPRVKNSVKKHKSSSHHHHHHKLTVAQRTIDDSMIAMPPLAARIHTLAEQEQYLCNNIAAGLAWVVAVVRMDRRFRLGTTPCRTWRRVWCLVAFFLDVWWVHLEGVVGTRSQGSPYDSNLALCWNGRRLVCYIRMSVNVAVVKYF